MTSAKGFARFLIRGEKSTHLIVGGIADILHRIVMALRKIVDFERQNRQKMVDMAPNAANAPFFPRPYFGRNVVEHRTGGVRLDPLGDLQIETGIVDQNHAMRLPFGDGVFTLLHRTQNRGEVEQHLHETHVGEFAVVAQQQHPLGLHQVAAETAKLGFGIARLERTHEMGRVQIARRFTGYKKIAHEGKGELREGTTRKGIKGGTSAANRSAYCRASAG